MISISLSKSQIQNIAPFIMILTTYLSHAKLICNRPLWVYFFGIYFHLTYQQHILLQQATQP